MEITTRCGTNTVDPPIQEIEDEVHDSNSSGDERVAQLEDKVEGDYPRGNRENKEV